MNEPSDQSITIGNIDGSSYNAIGHGAQVIVNPISGADTISYTRWCVQQRQWLMQAFQSQQISYARFGQTLVVAQEGLALVQRRRAWADFDRWFSTWQTHHRPLVVLGEEGDGKTWAIASWVYQLMQGQSEGPPVLFLTSSRITTNRPADLLTHEVAQHMDIPEHIPIQIKDWFLEETPTEGPLFLLVLDGINESYTFGWWRVLLEQLQDAPWYHSCAIVITCRTGYWNEHISPLRHIHVSTTLLEPYTDDELQHVLAAHQLRLSDILQELLPLARKPRYCDLLIRHRERLAHSGDITIARLIYEDWQDRLNRKSEFPISDQAFQEMLRKLASRYAQRTPAFQQSELIEALPFANSQMIDELRTSGVFHEVQGRFRIREPHLCFALALLLVDQVIDAVIDGHDVRETIAEWLEPHTAIDIKGQICEAAALRALHIESLPTDAKVALLQIWIMHQNANRTTATTIRAYFPVDPQSYFTLAEILWSTGIDTSRERRWLMHTFLYWMERSFERFEPLWVFYMERWLGFVCRDTDPYHSNQTEEERLKYQQALIRRIGTIPTVGEFSCAGYPFTAIEDDGLIRLGPAALALISHAPRTPFIRALAIGCVADAMMGHSVRYDSLAWIIRTAQQPIADLVLYEATTLTATHVQAAQYAAYRLLSFIGTYETAQLQDTFPADLFPPNRWVEQHMQDPCTSGFTWRAQDCEQCLQRTDIPNHWLAKQLATFCVNPMLVVPNDLGIRLAPLAQTIDIASMCTVLAYTEADREFETYEAALCAYAPEALADVVRRLIRDFTNRQGMAVRQLSFVPQKHRLILTARESQIIYQTWARIVPFAHTGDDNLEEAEEFIFPEVLAQLDAQAQLQHLIGRHEALHDWNIFWDYFKPLDLWEDAWKMLTAATSETSIRRILWFITAHSEHIPPHDIETYILPLLQHPNTLIRALALQCIFQASAENALLYVIQGEWCWNPALNFTENHWGSLILCLHGQNLSWELLQKRADPAYLGYAVHCRGNRPEEICAYAAFLDHLWHKIGTETPSIPSDFPPQYLEYSATETPITMNHRRSLVHEHGVTLSFHTQGTTWGGESEPDIQSFQQMMRADHSTYRQWQQMHYIHADTVINEQQVAGNWSFSRRFLLDGLDMVVEHYPELVATWVTNLTEGHADGVRRVQGGSTFYEVLCQALLRKHPESGLALYRYLQSIPLYVCTKNAQTGIHLLDYVLFEALPSTQVQHAWQHKLEQCTSDQAFLEVVLAAHTAQGGEWLWTYTLERLQVASPLAMIRAITLLGFIDRDASYDRLTALQAQVPETWLRDLVDTALRRWQSNTWAKHWFHQFLTHQDDVRAWAAFRLFLRCADRRFWLWKAHHIALVGQEHIGEKRMHFLRDNQDDIEKRLQKNEKDFTKHFLGHPIKDGQLWPWMHATASVG